MVLTTVGAGFLLELLEAGWTHVGAFAGGLSAFFDELLLLTRRESSPEITLECSQRAFNSYIYRCCGVNIFGT